MAMTPAPLPPKRYRIPLLWLNAAVFVLSALAIAVAASAFAHRDHLRWRFDATKTRAYSLSEQTQQLLGSLEGDWRISIVLVEDEVDRAVKRQIDEVLARCDAASEQLSVERIDPTDARSVTLYEGLISRLRRIYAAEVDQYESLLREARSRHVEVTDFAAAESERLRQTIGLIPGSDAIRLQFEQIRNGFALLGASGAQIGAVMDEALLTSETRPIPDYERGRDTLAAALSSAAQDLASIAAYYERLLDGPQLEAQLRAQLAVSRKRYDDLAQVAQTAADPLIHLPPLELSRIGRELAIGEAAVISCDDRAAVIPATQILPKANLRAERTGAIAFDQRFRGEQILAATIRSMLVVRMPLVVFVHAESDTMLRPRPDRAEVSGCASILTTARYEIREWNVTSGQEPVPADGQAAVWIVVPPPFTSRFKSGDPSPSRGELSLIETAQRLVDRGEPVLLSFYPSVMHRLRQPDLWQRLLDGTGWNVDTSRVLLESVLDASGNPVTLRSLDLVDLPDSHPVSRATSGQRLSLPLAVPLGPDPDAPSGVSVTLLAELDAAPNRWADPNWVDAVANPDHRPASTAILSDSAPLAIAIERSDPGGEARRQRMIVVGSGAWMQSDIADSTEALGGGRVALVNPGNVEFLQASVAWLAGMDDLIAQSPTSQQVERLEGVTDTVRNWWRIIVLVVMPGGCLALGVVVWMMRRM